MDININNIISPELLDAFIKFGINVLIIIPKIVIVLAIGLLHVAYATYFERKVVGHMQVRLGPMRVAECHFECQREIFGFDQTQPGFLVVSLLEVTKPKRINQWGGEILCW